MKIVKILRNVLVGAAVAAMSLSSHAALIGQWTFDDLTESTGNWQDLQLLRGATLKDGYLDLTAGGLQWANSVWDSNGPNSNTDNITSKTLVSWVELSNLSTRAGSALTLDTIFGDNFNGLIWSENFFNQWQIGSSYGRNLGSVNSNAAGVSRQMVRIAATWDWDFAASGVLIKLFVGPRLAASYMDSDRFVWRTDQSEAIFGNRHTANGTANTTGDLDAKIFEARIYDTALSESEIRGLSLSTASVSEPSMMSIMALGIFGLLAVRRRKQTN